MSSYLCTSCSMVHPKPGGTRCTHQKAGKSDMASAKGATGGKVDKTVVTQNTAKNTGETTTLKLCTQLLASVKNISAQMSHYDKRLNDLTQKMSQGSNTTASKPHTSAIQNKPMFTTHLPCRKRPQVKGPDPKRIHVPRADISRNRWGAPLQRIQKLWLPRMTMHMGTRRGDT